MKRAAYQPKRTITKSAPMGDEAAFRDAIDQLWQDVFRELHDSLRPVADEDGSNPYTAPASQPQIDLGRRVS